MSTSKKILIIHNSYQIKGGEDTVVEAEYNLLKENGFDVELLILNNNEINNVIQKIKSSISIFFDGNKTRLIKNKINEFKPDIVHFHNTWPDINVSIMKRIAKEREVKITLHNYRMICPTSLLFFDGEINENALENKYLSLIRKKVYKNSYLGTILLVINIFRIKYFELLNDKNIEVVTLTNFAKDKIKQSKLKIKNITVKPNFVLDCYDKDDDNERKHYLFVGRLVKEKGVEFINEFWSKDYGKLYVIGEGDFEFTNKSIINLGKKEKRYIYKKMRESKALLFPSIWYEGFPMVILESMMNSLPVISNDIGSMSEIIENGVNGYKYKNNAPNSLREVIEKLDGQDLSESTRANYLANYSEISALDCMKKLYGI